MDLMLKNLHAHMGFGASCFMNWNYELRRESSAEQLLLPLEGVAPVLPGVEIPAELSEQRVSEPLF